jgi:hypothetical protein
MTLMQALQRLSSVCIVAATFVQAATSQVSSDELFVGAFTSDSVTRHDAGNGAAGAAFDNTLLDGVLGIEQGPDGGLYVCSEETNAVLRFDPATGAFDANFIADDPQTAIDETGGLAGPADIIWGPDGLAYVGSFDNDSILRYDGRTGAFVDVFVATGAAGNLNGPDAGMAFGPGDQLYVPSFFNDRVKQYDVDGSFVRNLVGPVATNLDRPRTVLFPGDGFVYISSEGSDSVLKCDELTGDLVSELIVDDAGTSADETGGLDGPTGMAIGPDGALYVASVNTDTVLRYDLATGAFIDTFVGSGSFTTPTHLMFRPRSTRACVANANSVGAGAVLTAGGFATIAAGRFELQASFCPPGQLGVFIYGDSIAATVLKDGMRCVGNPLLRLQAVATDAAGSARTQFDPGSGQLPQLITPGSTWNFQFWYRDPSVGQGANLTDSLSVTFGA